MRVEELDYELPSGRIARHPTAERDAARLLVVHRGSTEHRYVRDLIDLLPRGALLIVNDTKVIPARLLGNKSTGGRVELLLVRRLDGDRFKAMGRCNKPLKPGARLFFADALHACVEHPPDEHGLLTVRLEADGDVDQLIDMWGQMPLPPYLRRAHEEADRERYQTVYAAVRGAVAAPTAGLHFTRDLLDALQQRGVERTAITLHVGPGTFRPVATEDVDDHPMHSEAFTIPESTVDAIAKARERSAPVIAVGTTVVRALESAADPARPGCVLPTSRDTDLLIQPGYRYRVVDRLLTNFHLPRSTLLALVYAFGGVARVRAAYLTAIEHGYRFYSYGDAMLLTHREAL